MKTGILITMLLFTISVFGQTPNTRVCDFDGENVTQICSLTTTTGIGTTFRLPDGMRIKDFVVTNPTNFHAESNGAIAIVTPRRSNVSTSVNIVSDNDKLFVFYLTSAGEPEQVDQLAIVQSTDYQLFQAHVRSTAQSLLQEQRTVDAMRFDAELEKQIAQTRKQLIFSLNSNYRLIGNGFPIDGVADDGVFTYVNLARSQDRPPVYLGDAAKVKDLEVVKYTDEGDHYVIHRVLTSQDKGFVLKLGDKTIEIRRR